MLAIGLELRAAFAQTAEELVAKNIQSQVAFGKDKAIQSVRMSGTQDNDASRPLLPRENKRPDLVRETFACRHDFDSGL